MAKITQLLQISSFSALTLTLASCVSTSDPSRPPNMGFQQPGSELIREKQIATEPTGDFFYARRYFVEKTRFWGYLRKPRQPWSEAKLVVMNEDLMRQPDRLPENGPWNARHGFDNNYEYRISGHYTGHKIYEPSSNLFLPEFKATNYTRLKTKPGWLFTPEDHYNPTKVTLINKSVVRTR